ncbi:MAG: hypothetical protein J6P48_04195 [Oscillospiraceae bacterium]|nr:hypothetical protein [Oscillospiraceae bacterium]
MKKFVQITSMLLMAVMLFSLCACGLGNIGKIKKIETIPTIQQTTVETPAPAPAVDEKAGSYEAALAMMVDEDYEGAAAAFEALGDYKDSAERAAQAREKMQDNRYQEAVALMEAGEIREAFAAFNTMPGYKDVDERMAQLQDLVAMQDELAGAKERDIVTFGTFEQDNKRETESEPIEWIVIGKEDDSLTLLSLYVLVCGPYHEERSDITWEDSALRHWLNDEFISAAFSGDERNLLVLTTVPPHGNPKYPYDFQNNPITPGNETNDRVWILSEEEAKALPASILKAESTKYAKSGGFGLSSGGSYHFSLVDPTVGWWADNQGTMQREETYVDYSTNWWLRTPGDLQRKAMYVSSAGKLMYEGYYVNMQQFGIRPVICVKVG